MPMHGDVPTARERRGKVREDNEEELSASASMMVPRGAGSMAMVGVEEEEGLEDGG